ncbi:11615_t:CDS:1, partial [Scutellospora calospora]
DLSKEEPTISSHLPLTTTSRVCQKSSPSTTTLPINSISFKFKFTTFMRSFNVQSTASNT